MNNFSIHSLAPDELDELLSAHLDGELDAACSDLGYDLGTVRNAIDSSPIAAARLAILGHAITAMEPDRAEELDEISRRRLVKATLGHVSAQRSGGVSWGTAAAGLVAVAAFAGAIFITSRGDSGGEKTASNSSTQVDLKRDSEAEASATNDGITNLGPKATLTHGAQGTENFVDLHDLGTIADVEDLTRRLSKFRSPTEGGEGGRTQFALMRQACASSFNIGDSSKIRFVARGVYQRNNVLVVEADADGGPLRWLVREDTCQVLLTVDS